MLYSPADGFRGGLCILKIALRLGRRNICSRSLQAVTGCPFPSDGGWQRGALCGSAPTFHTFPVLREASRGRNIVCPETALNRFNSLITMADTLLLFHKSYLLSAFVDRTALREIIHWDSHRCQAGIRLPSGSASPTYSNTGVPASRK